MLKEKAHRLCLVSMTSPRHAMPLAPEAAAPHTVADERIPSIYSRFEFIGSIDRRNVAVSVNGLGRRCGA